MNYIKRKLKALSLIAVGLYATALNATPADPVADAEAILTTASGAWDTVAGILVAMLGVGVIVAIVKKVKRG